MPTFGTTDIPISPPIRNALDRGAFQSIDTRMITWNAETLSLVVLPKGWGLEKGRSLTGMLLAQLRTSRNGVLATTYLEAEEYGWGNTEGEAVMDLVTSLLEYKESLETRQNLLGDAPLADLKKLRQLFEG